MAGIQVIEGIQILQVMTQVFGNDVGMIVDEKGVVGIDLFVNGPNGVHQSRDAGLLGISQVGRHQQGLGITKGIARFGRLGPKGLVDRGGREFGRIRQDENGPGVGTPGILNGSESLGTTGRVDNGRQDDGDIARSAGIKVVLESRPSF